MAWARASAGGRCPQRGPREAEVLDASAILRSSLENNTETSPNRSTTTLATATEIVWLPVSSEALAAGAWRRRRRRRAGLRNASVAKAALLRGRHGDELGSFAADLRGGALTRRFMVALRESTGLCGAAVWLFLEPEPHGRRRRETNWTGHLGLLELVGASRDRQALDH